MSYLQKHGGLPEEIVGMEKFFGQIILSDTHVSAVIETT